MKGTVYFKDKHTEYIIRYAYLNDETCVFETNTANYIYTVDGPNKYFWRIKHVTYGYGGYKTIFVPVCYIDKIILKEVFW